MLLMKLGNFSQNLSAISFSEFSTLSKFAQFYDNPIWCDFIVHEIILDDHQH